MGYINIEIGGSFMIEAAAMPEIVFSPYKTFSAIEHGHADADAVAQAIEYLSGAVLPNAIALDHKLHSEGQFPNAGSFRRPYTTFFYLAVCRDCDLTMPFTNVDARVRWVAEHTDANPGGWPL